MAKKTPELLVTFLEICRSDRTSLQQVENAFSNTEILIRNPTECRVRYCIDSRTISHADETIDDGGEDTVSLEMQGGLKRGK